MIRMLQFCRHSQNRIGFGGFCHFISHVGERVVATTPPTTMPNAAHAPFAFGAIAVSAFRLLTNR
jgi:hypothetical protein